MIDPSRIPAVDVMEASARLGDLGEPGGDVGKGTDAGNRADAGSPTSAPRPLLVDVREPNEFVQVRAEGAVLVPLSTFMLRYRELPTDRPLLMICQTGARSGQATAFLLANGWVDVANVAGGTVAWERAGLPVSRGAPAPGEGDLPA